MGNAAIGKVVKVVGPSEVVVNLGARDGVTDRTKFLIYRLGERLHDPETGTELDELEMVRGRGSAFHVQDQVTTVRSSVERRRQVIRRYGGRGGLLSPFAGTEDVIYEPEVEPFEDVEVGDLVRVLP